MNYAPIARVRENIWSPRILCQRDEKSREGSKPTVDNRSLNSVTPFMGRIKGEISIMNFHHQDAWHTPFYVKALRCVLYRELC